MDYSFKSGRNLATATVILLTLVSIASLTSGLGYYLLSTDGLDFDAPFGWRGLIALTELTGSSLFIATAVTFSMWVYRATANLPALGAVSQRFSPSTAVWAFYIPFVNLVRGYQVMAMIWTESQPLPVSDAGFLKPRSSGIVNLWWTLWIGGKVLSWCTLPFVGAMPALEWTAFFKLVYAASGVTCAIMVHLSDSRQREQAIDLARRASVPQPTGMDLR